MTDDIFEIGDVKNPQYASADNQTIKVTVTFPKHPTLPPGIPFHACADDPTDHGKQLWSDLIDGKYGKIAKYVDPDSTSSTSGTSSTGSKKTS